ncbi:MAG: helix-turn-helix domain-containing protein [Clostridiales bacterium]|nr:helix-turn-helix domain-containing protein [Clostridiales bacterium]
MIIKTADRIKSSRENLAVTQAELARKLSVTRACVNAWEMGISIPLVGKDGGACRGV